jgi:aminopeptidase N
MNAEFKGIPIAIYYFNEHRDAAESSLQTAAQAVATYSQLFGAYPYKSLAIVDSLFFDGMESDAIFFLDQTYFLQYNYSPRNYLTMLTAHEVAHNWWFGKVGNDQALEPWLDEALCIYSEGLYYESNYPEMVDWWWEFRIDRFRPTGSVNSTIYDHAGFESYVQAVYMRGAQFVQRLRVAMGDSAFFAFIAEYASVGSGKIISGEDFFVAVSDLGSIDVDVVKADFFSE